MKGRKLRQDELDLWKQVADRVTPSSSRDIGLLSSDEQTLRSDTKTAHSLPPFQEKIVGGKSAVKDNLAPTLQHSLSHQAVTMDRKAFKKLRSGKLKPDGRIDLHGMTLDRAHSALNRFVLSSHASGKRLLLVITGKGKHRDDGGPIPVRFGVLRHQVPEWLKLPPLSSVVLQVTQAHISHGGGGAYYVYLRRSR